MQRNATSLALQQRQRRAAAALASGHSVTRTARILGINPCTIYRWLHQPSFRQAIEAAIAERKRAERELIERMAERAADSLSRELSRRRSTVGKVALIRGVLDLATITALRLNARTAAFPHDMPSADHRLLTARGKEHRSG